MKILKDIEPQKAVLLLMPAIIPLVAIAFVTIFGPYEGDPNYGPLMSAQNLLHLEPPGYLDHPGTPIHILGAFVLALAWLIRLPVSGFSGLDRDILLHPNLYLFFVNVVIAILIACANWFLGFQLRRQTGSTGAALAGQATIFMAFPYLLALPLVTPDSLLIVPTTVMMALLVPAAFSQDGYVADRRCVILLGAAYGVSVATKITCVPLGFMLLLLRDRRAIVATFAVSLIAFLICILPGLRIAPVVAQYYLRIAGHTGFAGTGPAGVLTFHQLLANFVAIVPPGQGLLAALVLCALVLLAGFPGKAPGNMRRLFVLAAPVMLMQLALVTKNPGDRYLEPAYAVTSLLYPALWVYAAPSRRRVTHFGVLTLMALVALGAWRTTWRWLVDASAANRENAVLVARAEASGCMVIPYYDAPTTQYRLFFGNFTAHWFRTYALAKLYPRFLAFQNGGGRLQSFDKVLTPDEAIAILHRQKCVYLIGSGRERFDVFSIPPYALEPVARSYHGPAYSIAISKLKVTPSTSWADLGLPPPKDYERKIAP